MRTQKDTAYKVEDTLKNYKGPPEALAVLLQPTFCLRNLTCMDCTNGLPCPLSFGWVWSTRGTSRNESKYLFLQLPPWQMAVVGWLQPSTHSRDFCQAVLSMDLFHWLCSGSVCLSFRLRGGEHFPDLLPPKDCTISCLSLVSFSKSPHTHVNSRFIRYSSNYPFWFMLLSCQNADW